MNSPSRALARIASAAVSLALAAGAFAQSYGLGDQVLSLGHAAFHGADSNAVFHMGADGYLDPTSQMAIFLAKALGLHWAYRRRSGLTPTYPRRDNLGA